MSVYDLKWYSRRTKKKSNELSNVAAFRLGSRRGRMVHEEALPHPFTASVLDAHCLFSRSTTTLSFWSCRVVMMMQWNVPQCQIQHCPFLEMKSRNCCPCRPSRSLLRDIRSLWSLQGTGAGLRDGRSIFSHSAAEARKPRWSYCAWSSSWSSQWWDSSLMFRIPAVERIWKRSYCSHNNFNFRWVSEWVEESRMVGVHLHHPSLLKCFAIFPREPIQFTHVLR